MSRYRSLHPHFHALLKHRYSLCCSEATYSPKSSFLSSYSFSPKIDEIIGPRISEGKEKKRLDEMFKEAVGLSQLVNESESENGENDVKRKLLKLERSIKKSKSKSKSESKEKEKTKDLTTDKPKKLSSLFSTENKLVKKPEERGSEDGSRHVKKLEERGREDRSRHVKKPEEIGREDRSICKDLSPDMEVFVSHLYKEGYFEKANFLPEKKLDFSCFKNSYSREFIKFAAERFGRDKQEIAKWLSASDLKKVVLFGCPSLAKKSIFAAKNLRKFFEIQEDTVCSKCVLKDSCEFPNQSVWRSRDAKNLNLSVVMKIITVYGLESVHPQLTIPDDIKACVSRLLNEILKLSQTVSSG